VVGTLFAVALAQSVSAAGGVGPGGATPAPHMSSGGLANTNSKFGADRDKGLDRAEDRMSAEGLAHEQATNSAKRGKSAKRDSKNKKTAHPANS
jgi:hypothetical protein